MANWPGFQSRSLLKPIPYRDEVYRAWIREFPCLICKAWPTEAAHTGPHGLGTKASDIQIVPLCKIHHTEPGGLDRLGPDKFEARYNIDLKQEILWFLNFYITTGHALGSAS